MSKCTWCNVQYPNKQYISECLDSMQKLESDYYGDTEYKHESADEILCSVLRHLGYNELVDSYEGVDKCY